MQRFVEFWVDGGRLTPCCQFANDEDTAGDESVYNCDSCVVADQLGGLDHENARAWSVFHRLCSRFVSDWHLGPHVLARLTSDDDADTFEELVNRLALIYDVYFPPRRGDA